MFLYYTYVEWKISMAQNDGESIDNLNYSWHQVSILHIRGMENFNNDNVDFHIMKISAYLLKEK